MDSQSLNTFIKKNGKNLFYGFLVLCLILTVFVKLYNPMPWEPFAAICFCGVVGLLMDFAWKNKKSLWAIPPVLLSADLIGYVMKNMGHRDIAGLLFNFSGALWPLSGLILLGKAGRIWKEHRSLALKLVVLGFLCVMGATWEYRMYLPEAAFGWIRHSVIYLGIFGILLLIDFTEDLEAKQMKLEQGIMRAALVVISFKYFIDFVFV